MSISMTGQPQLSPRENLDFWRGRRRGSPGRGVLSVGIERRRGLIADILIRQHLSIVDPASAVLPFNRGWREIILMMGRVCVVPLALALSPQSPTSLSRWHIED
jgi:hypothetical protein